MFFVEQNIPRKTFRLIIGGRMEIKKEFFEFVKAEKGKKFHIIPINGIKCLALCLKKCTGKKFEKAEDGDVCKYCKQEYEKVERSGSFTIFCK